MMLSGYYIDVLYTLLIKLSLFMQNKTAICWWYYDKRILFNTCTMKVFKEGLQSVLRIGSVHNKGGPPNINIVQISHFSNSF